MAPFEVNLKTGVNRLLGGERLRMGVTMFPVLSPDKTTLAVWHRGNGPKITDATLNLIDVVTGDARAVGPPRDAVHLSWLPDGSQLITVLHEHAGPDQPSVPALTRIDLKNGAKRLGVGDQPVVVAALERIIFFDRAANVWKKCDFEGRHVELIGDGLRGFSFPSQARDGRHVLMMKFDTGKPPRPFVVDASDGSAERVPVSLDGLYALPAW